MNSALRLIVVVTLTLTQLASPLQRTSSRQPPQNRFITPAQVIQNSNGRPASFDPIQFLRAWYSGNAPTAVNDSYILNEDAVLNVPAISGVLANDLDNELDPLIVSLPVVSEPTNGMLQINANGSFEYTPDADFYGIDSFTYIALDDTPSPSNLATVTLNITAVNDDPLAVNDSGSVAEDGQLNVSAPGLLTNDSDIELDLIFISGNTQPANGSVTVQSNGAYLYTPGPDYFGPDFFTYTLSDGNGGSDTATVNLMVTEVNDAPRPGNDALSTAEDSPLEIEVATLLANDLDVEDDPLTITAFTQPAHGDLVDNLNDTYTYTPDPNFFSSDSFTYTVSDGDLSTTANVAISVTSVNDLPSASPDSYPATEDTQLSVAAPGVLANDSDLEGPLSAVLLTSPATGTLILNANGAFTYTPAANANGAVTFTYRAFDGTVYTGSTTVTMTIAAVNDTPLATNDSAFTDEDTPLNIAAPGVLTNDSDVESSITAVLLTPPATGSLTFNPNGSYSYTPAANANGVVTFTYRAYDGALYSAPATVTITINAQPDAPAAQPDSLITSEDTAYTFGSAALLSNDSDPDGDTLSVNALTDPPHGTVVDNGNATFTYTPDLNYFGSDSFTYRALDPTGRQSAITTVTISVAAVNDLPSAVADSYSTNEDTQLNVAAPGVLTNDSDVEGPLTAVLLTAPATGILVLNADGSFTYTPLANASGAVTFTYRAYDGVAYTGTTTVTITIAAVNDTPVAVNDIASTNEDTLLTIAAPGVLTNDSDVDSSITAVLFSPPATGSLTLNSNGGYTYTPVTNANGVVTFQYRAFDGEQYSTPATVTITIVAQPDAPVAETDSFGITEDSPYTFGSAVLLGNDSDPDGETLSVDTLTDPLHGTVVDNGNGTFTYTPDLNYNGADSFTYRALDPTGRRSAVTTVSVTINAVNDAPVAANDSFPATEDIALTVTGTGVLGNDSDVDSPFTAVLLSAPATGALSFNANGTFTYTPVPNANGVVTFTYRAYDGLLYSAPATVTINIAAVNDPPTATNDNASTNEDVPLVVSAPGVLGNDSDVDSSITAVLLSAPATGTLNLTANGAFTYTPVANASGVVTFTYRAYDGALYSAPATVTITINPINDPPVAVPDTYAATEDTPLIVAAPGVISNDTDIESNPLTAVRVAGSGPNNGALVFNSDGSFTYTPTLNFNGVDQFSYYINDGALNSNTVVVTLNVAAVNDPPVAAADTYSTPEDTPLVVTLPGVLQNDSDVDTGTILRAFLVTSPATGTLTLNENGAFTYTPALNANGVVTFTYRANDGTLNSAPATVTITVTAVNDAPIALDQAASTPEDIARAIALLVSDVDNVTLNYTIPARSAHGALSGTAPNLTYTPDLNYFGPDTFTYTVSDGSLNDSAVVTLTVNAVNDAPVGVNDAYSVNEDTVLVVPVAGVLSNDSDVDNVTFNAVSYSGPTHGALTLNTNGSFTYNPSPNYNGADSFIYRAYDGSLYSPQITVNITVNAVNDLPVALGESYTTNEDTPLIVAAAGLLTNDSDIDGDTLRPVLITTPTRGNVEVSNDGSFVFTPTTNIPDRHIGSVVDSFTYRVFDGTASSTATVTASITIVEVNDAPIAESEEYDVGVDGYLSVQSPGLLGNDYDVENDQLTVELFEDTEQPGDQLTVNPDGSFEYIPYPNMPVGSSVTFTYRTYDAQTQNAYSPPTPVTIQFIDPGGPQLNWVAPVFNGNVMKVGVEEVQLSVTTDSCPAPCSVYFFRYRPNGDWVILDVLQEAPYMMTLDTNTLDLDWNQIYATASYWEEQPNPEDPPKIKVSPRQRILLRRYNWSGEPHRLYLPGVSK